MSGIRTQILLDNKRNYRIINGDKVIVYSNNDYYLILDCKKENNNLVIYKGKQEKISNTKVYSVYIEFDTVEIK